MNSEEIFQLAKADILKSGDCIPKLIAQTAEHTYMHILLNLFDEHQKTNAFLLGRHFGKAHADEVIDQLILISEIWLSIWKEGELPNAKPREDPKRKEALAVQVINISGDTLEPVNYIAEMIRYGDGKLQDLLTIDTSNCEMDNYILMAFYRGYKTAARLTEEQIEMAISNGMLDKLL
jgi:hypothetical protein